MALFVGEDLASWDMNSEALIVNQFLEEYHFWVEGTEIELLFVVWHCLGLSKMKIIDLPY